MRAYALSLAAASAVVATAIPLTAEGSAFLRHLEYGPGVEWSNWLVPGPSIFRADRRTLVRAAPAQQERVTMILDRGEVVDAAGLTQDGWVAIARDGVVVGYVSESRVSALD